MTEVLVLYFSRNGATANMARQKGRGGEQSQSATALIRTVPLVQTGIESDVSAVPDDGPPYASLQDLKDCDALILGSPTHFGNMAADLKYFIDQTSSVWMSGALESKPAAVFTATGSMHGGQETTLISMMLPLLHHGMLMVGLPYSNPVLNSTETGGTPYGASHLSVDHKNPDLSDDEETLCQALGKRVADIATRLRQ